MTESSLVAKNLAQKIPKSSKLYICDVNKERIQTFVKDHGQAGNVEILDSPQVVADHSVSEFNYSQSQS